MVNIITLVDRHRDAVQHVARVGAPEQSAEAVIAGTPEQSALASRFDGWRSRRTSPRRRSSFASDAARHITLHDPARRRRRLPRPVADAAWAIGPNVGIQVGSEVRVIIIIALLLIIAVAVVFNTLAANATRKAEAEALRNRTYRPGDPFSTADDDAVRGDPRQLKPADLVDIRGTTFAVRGVIRFTQDGYNWIEAHLDTGTGQRVWLSVEDDPTWRSCSGSNWAASPSPRTPDDRLRGPPQQLRRGRRRQLHASAGTTGAATSGTMRYHDYEAGNARLSFEDYGSGWEAARGEVLARSELRIYLSNPSPEAAGDSAGRSWAASSSIPGPVT